MKTQQNEAKAKSKRNQIGTVTCTNHLDLWKAFESKARVAGERFGYKVTVDSLHYKDTGEEAPKREATPVTPSDRHEVIVRRV